MDACPIGICIHAGIINFEGALCNSHLSQTTGMYSSRSHTKAQVPQGGSSHVTGAWSDKERIKSHLDQLRDGSLTRAQAYDLFLKGKVYGLGPAYWTKLLYFFSPTDDFYIMDQ